MYSADPETTMLVHLARRSDLEREAGRRRVPTGGMARLARLASHIERLRIRPVLVGPARLAPCEDC